MTNSFQLLAFRSQPIEKTPTTMPPRPSSSKRSKSSTDCEFTVDDREGLEPNVTEATLKTLLEQHGELLKKVGELTDGFAAAIEGVMEKLTVHLEKKMQVMVGKLGDMVEKRMDEIQNSLPQSDRCKKINSLKEQLAALEN